MLKPKTMKVKRLENAAGPGGSIRKGTIQELPVDEAKALIGRGYVCEIDDEDPQVEKAGKAAGAKIRLESNQEHAETPKRLSAEEQEPEIEASKRSPGRPRKDA